MANMAKYTKASVVRLGKHYEREKENGKYVKFGNQEIDTSKSHLNYNLAPNRNMTPYAFVKKRTSEVRCLSRKNINVMASWVVTMPSNFPQEKATEFFEKSYEFLNNRYDTKSENTISSYVHMDETTPHMHYAFVPVVYDKKRKDLKVSAKDCINRSDLQTFHKDLTKHLEKHFGFKIDILNDATRDGNKSIDELKRLSATKDLQEAKKVLKSYDNASVEYANLKKGIEIYSKAIMELADESGVARPLPEYAELIKEKPLFSKKVTEYVKVPRDKWDAKTMAYGKIHEIHENISVFTQRNDVLEKRYHEARNENVQLQGTIKFFRGFINSLPRGQEQLSQYREQLTQKRPKTKKKTQDLER